MGSSAQAIILKIVSEEPLPVTRLRKTVPEHVAAAVAQALEKLPADRFATATEFAHALAMPGSVTTRTRRVGTVPVSLPFPGLRLALLLVVGVVGAMLGATIMWLVGPKPDDRAPDTARLVFEAVLSPSITYGPALDANPATGDVVFVGVNDQGPQLFRRPLTGREAVALAAAVANLLMSPTFSSDGTNWRDSGSRSLPERVRSLRLEAV